MRAGKSALTGNRSSVAGSRMDLKRHRFSLEKGHIAYVMIAPFIIVFCVFSLYTVLYTFYLSFTDTLVTAPNEGKFVALKNYTDYFKSIATSMGKNYDKAVEQGASDSFATRLKVLFDYDNYHLNLKSIVNTWKIWLVNFIPQISIAMLLSVWFNSSFLKIKVVGLWRSLLYLPNMLMPATVGVIFFKFFQDTVAPANLLLGDLFGIAARHFMAEPPFTQNLVSFIQWWMWYGNTIVILVAGMSSISSALYESATIDGAGGWQMFRYITLPSLRPILVYTLVTSLVGGMQMFDIPFLISPEGAPLNTVTTMFMRMQQLYAKGRVIGISATVGVIILLITAISSLLIFRVLRDQDEHMAKKAAKLERKERSRRQKSILRNQGGQI